MLSIPVRKRRKQKVSLTHFGPLRIIKGEKRSRWEVEEKRELTLRASLNDRFSFHIRYAMTQLALLDDPAALINNK